MRNVQHGSARMGHPEHDAVDRSATGRARRPAAGTGPLVLGLVLAIGCIAREESSAMSLNVELRPSRTEFVLQESPRMDFALVNTGSEPVAVVPPGQARHLPVLKLVGPDGEERVFRANDPRVPPETESLAPGARLDWSFELEERCRVPGPGDYVLSILYPYGDPPGRQVESEGVRLHVLPSTGESLELASVRGAPGPVQSGVWLDTATNPRRVMRGSFSLIDEHPRPMAVAVLAEVAGPVVPELSAPPAGQVSNDHWTAWVEGGRLAAVHYSEESGASEGQRIELDGRDALLVGPLYTDPVSDPAERPAGAALVWESEGGGRFAVVELGAGGLRRGPTAPAPGRPVWARSFTRSDGSRGVVTLRESEGRLVLGSAPWPGAAGEARELGRWTDELVGAGAAVDTADVVRGAVLLAGSADRGEPPPLRLVRWSLSGDGEWKESAAEALAWEAHAPPAWARLEISNAGAVATLLRDARGHVFTHRSGGSVLPVLQGADDTQALALAFRSDYDPLLVTTRAGLGLQIVGAQGAPLGAEEREGAAGGLAP